LVSTAVVVSAQKQALNGNSRQVNLPAKFTTRKTRVFRSLLLGYFHGEIFFCKSHIFSSKSVRSRIISNPQRLYLGLICLGFGAAVP
jgi:hypothetical protein